MVDLDGILWDFMVDLDGILWDFMVGLDGNSMGLNGMCWISWDYMGLYGIDSQLIMIW